MVGGDHDVVYPRLVGRAHLGTGDVHDVGGVVVDRQMVEGDVDHLSGIGGEVDAEVVVIGEGGMHRAVGIENGVERCVGIVEVVADEYLIVVRVGIVVARHFPEEAHVFVGVGGDVYGRRDEPAVA